MAIKQLLNTTSRMARVSSTLEKAMAMQEWVEQTLLQFSHIDPKKPEEFASLMKEVSEDKMGSLFSWIFINYKTDTIRYHKLEFVYLRYDFVESHLEKLIKELEHLSRMKTPEDKSCCSDTIRWLINGYVNYVLEGVVPKNRLCALRSPQLWFDWIDAMSQLYYGDIVPYTKALELLTEAGE